MRPSIRLIAPSLLLGLALGTAAAAVWFATRPSASDLLATRYSLPTTSPSAPASWSWRDSDTPPPLPAASVTPAIAAWLAQRSPDGAPADFATRATSLRALLVRLPSTGFPGLADALSRSTRDEDPRLLREAFNTWAALDAPAATRWAAGQGSRSLDLAHDAVRLWAAQDAPAAAAWLSALADENMAARLAPPALAALAEKDPARALALARSRGQSFLVSALSGIVNTLGRADPSGTVRTYGPDLWLNGGGLYMLREPLTAWVNKNPAAALAWLVAQPRDPRYSPFGWINSFGNRTPEWRRTVADAFLNGPDQAHRAASLKPILADWSLEHPDEALAWLDGIKDRDLRLSLLERAAGQFNVDNPARALPLVLALPEGINRTSHLTQILSHWAKTDAPAALAWIQTHDLPGVATAGYAVQGTLLAAIARDEPQTAVTEWRNLQDPKAREATLPTLIHAWAQTDPVAAVRWAEEQSRSLGKPLQLDTGTISRWAGKEPEAALRWIEAWLPTQPKTTADFMAPRYFSALGGTSENRAPRADTANLLLKIKDPALRATTLTNHVREWLAKDPAAARAWIESSTALTPAQTAALLSPAN